MKWKLSGHTLGLLTLVTALLFVPAAPAFAAPAAIPILNESFESSSAASWTFDGSNTCEFCGYVENDAIAAHAGTNSAFIESWSWMSFYSVGTNVHLIWGASRSCAVKLYLSNVGMANIEVIDPTSWTYVALKTVPTTSVHYQFQSLSWSGGPSNVYFRVSTVTTSDHPDPWANIDDVSISCS